MCIYFSSKSHYFLTQAAEAIIKHSEQVYAGLHSMCLSSITYCLWAVPNFLDHCTLSTWDGLWILIVFQLRLYIVPKNIGSRYMRRHLNAFFLSWLTDWVVILNFCNIYFITFLLHMMLFWTQFTCNTVQQCYIWQWKAKFACLQGCQTCDKN